MYRLVFNKPKKRRKLGLKAKYLIIGLVFLLAILAPVLLHGFSR